MSLGAQYLTQLHTIGAGQTLWYWWDIGGPTELTYIMPLPSTNGCNLHIPKHAIEIRDGRPIYWTLIQNTSNKTVTFQLGAYQFGVFPGNL
jgi:hypothetical protein